MNKHIICFSNAAASGASISLFNSVDGEWEAEIIDAGKRKGRLLCSKMTKPLQMPPDLWFLFAPIKKSRTDFIVEKAAEMGAARIIPVQTEFAILSACAAIDASSRNRGH